MRKRYLPPKGLTVKPGPTVVDREKGYSWFRLKIQDRTIAIISRMHSPDDGYRPDTVFQIGLLEHLQTGLLLDPGYPFSAKHAKFAAVRIINKAMVENGWRPDWLSKIER